MTETNRSSPPRALAVLFSLVQFFGIAGFVIAEIVHLIQHGTGGFHLAALA